MNRFLSNINKIPISVKHLSGKYDLNQICDHQSRHPSECETDHCSIHRFISDMSETVLDPATRCGPIQPLNTFFNQAAWLQAQRNNDSCRTAVSHLTSGKVPTTKPGDMNNEIRFLIKHATIAPDGL